MARLTLLLGIFGLAFVMLGVLQGTSTVDASQLLENGGFDSWDGDSPTGWHLNGLSATHSGSAAALTLSGGSGRLFQSVPAVGGGNYTASISVKGPSSVSATVRLVFDGNAAAAETRALSPAFTAVTTTANAPEGTGGVTLQIDFNGSAAPGEVQIDSASLDEFIPPPTSTPTPEPTETPTATSAAVPSPTATRTNVPAGATSASGSATNSPTPTRTATATRTPTAPKQATSTRTPTPPKAATSTRTPTPSKQATATRTPRPAGLVEPFGGLLLNGNFEDVEDERPVGWSKVGGTMSVSTDAFRGDYAASLESSTTSTKWLYQVVSVDPGAWYEASVQARVEGAGTAFLRLSWYESDDGSGTTLSQDDSTATISGGWAGISTGAVQAPTDARSVRVRLTLAPDGPVTGFFDDAQFLATSAPPPTPTSTPAPKTTPAAGGTALATAAPGGSRGSPRPAQPFVSGPSAAGDGVSAVTGLNTGLRLSEFLSDPEETGRDSPFEWVEIVNTSAEPISLAGWSIADAGESDPLPDATVPSNGYVVVGAKSVELGAGIVVVRLADGEIGSGLNNSGDTIRLIAPDGREADAISFGDDDSVFDPPPPAPPAGKTAGIRSLTGDPDGGNWSFTQRPTPGEANVFSPAAEPTKRTAGAQSSAVFSGGPPSTPLTVNRGEGGSSILWIVGAIAAASAILGAPPAWRRYRKKSDVGS